MRKIYRAVTVAAALAITQSAAAADWAFDAKVGFALPMGNVWGTEPWTREPMPFAMSTAWSGAVPLRFDARYHVSPNISLGAYFGWGPAFVKDSNYFAGPWNSGYDMRVGIELMYEFLPSEALNPWFLIGSGWEWTNFSGANHSVTMNGWEYLNVQAGLDFGLSRAFGIGPYVGFQAGTYSSMDMGGQPGGGKIPPDSRAFHGWFQFGVKGTLNL
jgi:hypothetical protein